jgi:DNA gyrase inhibitor GyrI
MKTSILIATVLIVLLMSTQALISRSTGRTEQQPYEIHKKQGDFEIRYYPPAILASLARQGHYATSSGSSFRTLAGYIFGGNDASEQIAMTSPVRMKQEADTFGMQFVMPASYAMDKLPRPNDPSIRLERFEGGYYASIRFGGYADAKDWNARRAELKAFLDREGLRYEEPFEYLGYNPPYQFINRRNEVVVRLKSYQP